MLSPIEIKKQEFSKTLRGYDPDEVRNFLESISLELEKISEDNRAQQIELEKLRAELSTYSRMEKNMNDAMVSAEKALSNARSESERESDLLRREAKIEAENILRDALNRADEIGQEIQSLEMRRNSFVRKWKHMLSSEIEMLCLLDEIDTFPDQLDTEQEHTNAK